MSGVDPLAAFTRQGGDTRRSGELGQNEFLKLMMAQLKNQDPLKPTDPSEFLGQLAQFSTVTSIQNMEGSVTGLADSLRSSQVLSGTTMVGHDIIAAADSVTHTSGTTVQGSVEAPEGTSSLQVAVRDSAGQLIRRFTVTPEAGTTEFTWDGLTDRNETAATGTYDLEVVATISGQQVSLQPMLASRVESVTIDASGLILNTTTGPIPLANVRRVQ